MRAVILTAFLLFAPAPWAQPLLKVTQLAELADGLSQPHDAAFSPDGKLIFVTDMRNSRIRVLEAMTLKPVGTFGEGELSYPHDAEFDKSGRLLIADTGNDRVVIYAVQGTKARLAGELKGLPGPEGIAVAPDGRIIVTNTRAATLSVFRDGKLERTVGRHGARDGEFSNPHDVEAGADGSVYVVDSGNDRVQVFDSALKHRSSFGAALKLDGPKYISFDGDRIWLADEDNHRILLLDRNHRLLGVLGTGRRGRGPNAYYKPEAVLARAPHVWVIDTYNDRIVLLRVEQN
ncbi:MAG: NHL repeat-containing protein [Burkholderiales bacterium]|nr:NHL repeat-containing protein [Burkholderiales bacterium]